MDQALINIWSGIYDEALHSDRYKGQAAVYVDYDALNASMKDWNMIQKDFDQLLVRLISFSGYVWFYTCWARIW